MGSVAVADVPVSPLSCRDASLTDRLTLCRFPEHGSLDRFHGGKDGGVGLAFLDQESVADLVGFLQVLWKFVHETIIGTGWAGLRVAV